MAGIFKCIFEFNAESKKELSLQLGDIIKVTRQINPDWYFGVSNNTKDGLFPAAYVEKVFDHIPNRLGIAVNKFTAEEATDLGLEKGDLFEIKKQLDQNWYQGATTKDEGIVPVSYIKEILFTNSTSTNNNQAIPSAIANQSFLAQDSDELTITEGIRIELVKELDDFWMLGKLNGIHGKFPKSFVDIIIDLPSHLKVNKSDSPEEEIPEAKAKAKFMFIATKPGELSFDKNEVILLVDRINKDWLKGKIGNTIGLFPANHVEVIVDLPYKEISEPSLPQIKSQSKIKNNNNDQTTSENYKPPNKSAVPERSRRHTVGVQKNNKITKEKRKSLSPSPNKIIITSNEIPTSQNKTLPHNTSNNNNHIKVEGNKPKKTSSFKNKFKKPLIAKKPEALKSPNQTKNNNDNRTRYEFELTDERLFDMTYDSPVKENKPIVADQSFTKVPRRKAPVAPSLIKSNSEDNNSIIMSKPPPRKHSMKLPKPLAPMPAMQKTKTLPVAARPMSLNLSNTNNYDPVLSPKSKINANSLTVSFTKQTFDDDELVTDDIITFNNNNNNKQMSRSETDPQLFKVKANKLSPSSADEKSLYFSSTQSSPVMSPDKRKIALDAMLQRSCSLRGGDSLKRKANLLAMAADNLTPSEDGSLESLTIHSQELKRVESEIVELKGKIEEEGHLLAGVDTLLDFVAEDKLNDLIVKKDKHNANIIELNNEINALEDEKSYLLASFGRIDDIKNRVEELEKQIEMYLDNCEQLRRMQDVAVIEDLPEIRDSIEFCENMVDTLQSELNGLKEKLGDFDQTDSSSIVKDEEDGKEKRKRKQKKIIEELVMTEKSYVFNTSLVTEKVLKHLAEFKNADIDVGTLFGNLSDIVQLSTKLLEDLEHINNINGGEDENKAGLIAQCFLNVANEMKECYAVYCRNYDDAQMVLEKYEEDEVISIQLKQAVARISNETGCFGLGSLLIKPVQRVLKYPLLLSELVKNEDGENEDVLVKAFNTVTDVATAINEFKRRKDLVQKYRETDDGISKKVQKLNWHSVAKKTNRINQRITQFTGLNSQTVDSTFHEEEKRFRSLEKLIKSLLKNILTFIEEFKENVSLERQSAESIFQSQNEKEPRDEIVKYYSKITAITELYASEMISFINQHVNEPLTQLLQLFPGPFRLIQKRNDKCLDYDRAKNKAKDAKERDRIKQTQEELQMAENIYTALNIQLLEELPTLSDLCSSYIQYCLSNFVEAYKRYFSKAFRQFKEIWELPFLDKNVDLFVVHHELVQEASLRISGLVFIPSNSTASLKERRSQTQVINMTNFFVEFGGNAATSPDSKPLIDFSNENDEDFVDCIKNKNRANSVKKELELEPPLQPIRSNDSLPNEALLRCSVKYTFIAEDPAEVSAEEGAIVSVLRKCDKNGNAEWWLVEYNGSRGYIPASFLCQEKIPLTRSVSDGHKLNERRRTNSFTSSDLPTLNPENNSVEENKLNGHTAPNINTVNTPENDIESTLQYTEYYGLEYDFEGLNKGELTLTEGQIVKVLIKHDQKGNPEWWYVECEGNQGYVPKNYLLFVDKVPSISDMGYTVT